MAVRLVRSKKRLIMKDGEVAISGFAFKTPPVRLGSRLGQHLLKNLGRISGAVASKTCAHEMPSSRYLRGDPVARKKKKRKKPRPESDLVFFTFISFSFQFSWWRMTWNSRDRYGSSCLRTIRVESQTLFSRCEKARKKNDGEEFYWRSSFFGIIERTNRKDFVENSILSMQKKKRKKKENTTCFALSKILRSHYRNEMARAFAKFPSVSQKKKGAS